MKSFALTLLLASFPLSASFTSTEGIKENCDYEYYPKLDHNSADELCTIKRNYYRYGEKLKMLADERIKEIKKTALNIGNKTSDLGVLNKLCQTEKKNNKLI